MGIYQYMEALQGVPSEWQPTILRMVDLIKEDVLSQVTVRREEFLDLKAAVEDLVQAQKRTEERVEELAQAQKRTEERMEELVRAHGELRREVEVGFRRVNTTLGAVGARWGLQSEESFRSAIEGILREDLSMQMERYLSFDPEGTVFGVPDQVEIDVVIRNGKTTLIEIKSSMSKADVHAFHRKIAFFEKQMGLKADRKIIISPMLGRYAQETIQRLGMTVYSTIYDVKPEEETLPEPE
ncbi:MAG: DUF3782 domain-containing protein [Candidatus Tectomicrobia bacterium]|uniref:DUF3782 domain-containing protein n=1 Tax=Tectimicrobiota bacterium TaxID=2528274 RepID=A0A932CN46_UNCTE|nr:DUF3782 domain-containing protein [Candidatus Tectomicrobia bacterium]